MREARGERCSLVSRPKIATEGIEPNRRRKKSAVGPLVGPCSTFTSAHGLRSCDTTDRES